MVRMMGLETAVKMMAGKDGLAEAMGITVRALTYKLNAERGVSDDDLRNAATALDQRALRVAAHAAKLRAQITPPAVDAATDWRWWSGTNDEWYSNGPFDTRDQAVAALDGHGGYIVEAQNGVIHFSADRLIQHQYYDDEDLFAYDYGDEPERRGPIAAIEAADAELQILLDSWLNRHRATFMPPVTFAATRNAEKVERDSVTPAVEAATVQA